MSYYPLLKSSGITMKNLQNNVIKKSNNTRKQLDSFSGHITLGEKENPRNSQNSKHPRHSEQHSKKNVEKYLALARDANSAGDRVAAEGYYQHAEHYFRASQEGKRNRE